MRIMFLTTGKSGWPITTNPQILDPVFMCITLIILILLTALYNVQVGMWKLQYANSKYQIHEAKTNLEPLNAWRSWQNSQQPHNTLCNRN